MNVIWSLLIFLAMTATKSSLAVETYPSLEGKWQGTLTQEEGGYQKNYHFTLEIHQNGRLINGRSQVSINQLFAEMKIKGQLIKPGVFEFSEIQILNMAKEAGMDWCYKHGFMRLERIGDHWRLAGEWSGFSEFGACVPGKIFLRKQRPKA